MPKAVAVGMSIPGVEVWISYLENSLRVTTVEWTIPVSGIVVRTRIYDIRQSETIPIYDRTIGVPVSGTENVPGNHRMVQVLDEEGNPFLDLPAYIKYHINIETIG